MFMDIVPVKLEILMEHCEEKGISLKHPSKKTNQVEDSFTEAEDLEVSVPDWLQVKEAAETGSENESGHRNGHCQGKGDVPSYAAARHVPNPSLPPLSNPAPYRPSTQEPP